MKSIIADLDKTFNHKLRVGIMAILVVNDWVDFNTLKDLLDIGDGALAGHLKGLRKSQYITDKKEFVARKPKTSYQATPEGKEAFRKHLNALEELIKAQNLDTSD